MNRLIANNVHIVGNGAKTMMMVHGYGCDQHVWDLVLPEFVNDHRIVLLDLVGSGGSDVASYDRKKYATLRGHAADILEICDELKLGEVTYVGHSVAAMIGVLAALARPAQFSELVMVAPSPSYINSDGYVGGFTRADIDGLLDFLELNYLGWADKMAPAIMGVPDRPQLAADLAASFCRNDPAIAKHFGRVTFLSDHREDVKKLTKECLILQCTDDLLAPPVVGRWLQRNLARSTLVELFATGHSPHVSAPQETAAAMQRFLAGRV